MRVSLNIGEDQKSLFEVVIDGLKEHGEVDTRIFSFEDQKINLRSKIVATGEFCIISQLATSKMECSLSFSVIGSHASIICESDNKTLRLPGEGIKLLLGDQLRLERAKSKVLDIGLMDNVQTFQIFILLSDAYLKRLKTVEHWDTEKFLPKGNCRFSLDFHLRTLLMALAGSGEDERYQFALMDLKLRELLLLLCMEASRKPAMGTFSKADEEKLLYAKSVLESGFTDPPTIVQLARKVALNEFKLKQAFKLRFGVTIHHFVIGLRMKQAEKMLKQSMTIAEVAEKIGYKSVSHFISLFKKQYGKTPKQVFKKLYT